jgi:hypothetical protein
MTQSPPASKKDEEELVDVEVSGKALLTVKQSGKGFKKGMNFRREDRDR